MSKSKIAKVQINFPFEAEGMCDECGGSIIETREGDSVCRECGVVFNQKNLDLNHLPRRMYNQEERKILEKNAPRPDFGNRTNIGNRGIHSKEVKDKVLYRRLSRINKNVINSYERALWFTKQELFNVFAHFEIPGIIEKETWKYYRKAVKCGFLKGYSMELTFSALLYVFCRKNNFPIFAKEITEYYNINQIQFNRALYRLFKRFNLTMPPLDMKKYLIRMCSEFNIKYENTLAELMIQAAKSHKGLDPRGILAAITYLIGGGVISQEKIAEFLGISEVTLRNRKGEINRKIKKINCEVDEILCKI